MSDPADHAGMNRHRFSIGSFLIVVSDLGLGLGAIVSQSEVATALAFSSFVSMLSLAAAVAISPRSERRVFCTGFAIFGLIYWLVEFQAPDVSLAASDAVMGGLFALVGGVLTLLFKVRSEAADERAISLPAESSRPNWAAARGCAGQ
jgi:hypothetical protein